MINTLSQFSDASVKLLQIRQLNEQEISGFADILAQAEQRKGSAKAFLQSLSPEELKLVQNANSMASAIEIDSLSSEGAQNLLSQPDGSDLVDLNNDGIVEVGKAKTIHFPPVNAPTSVKEAWEKATADLAPFEKATLELTMHHMVYGVNLDIPGAVQKTPLAPEKQWNSTNIQLLENYARSNLEFRINHEGWTPYNQQLKDVYNSFFATLAVGGISASKAPLAQTESAATVTLSDEADKTSERGEIAQDESGETKSSALMHEIQQLILAARLGIDREKIKELEKEMEAVRNDSSLSTEQKAEKLQALQKEIELLIEKAQERAVEEAKRKAMFEATTTLQKARLKLI